ncbi:uncharacterized protein LOC26526136 [Drosophila erecta]|uniref:Uncharacterized protein n=1 Tax=Drosophila erecta TaxID=7220 RepID=A0A0Q5TJU5_DROER|nr:uncharacterized protein LOC26526136 [Drosophila erecta]KQS30603.1 uncharacterized protein Dere_GG26312 [Drosophila erecta]
MRWQLVIMWLFVSALATPGIRWRRQIVTPKHLIAPPLSPISQDKVVVTPQKLREVADLKAMIQKAVDENTYMVSAAPTKDFLATLAGNWGAPLSLPHSWIPPAFNLTIFWPGFG